MNDITPSGLQQFQQNASDFVKKYGMKAASLMYIGINFVYLGQNFTSPDEANLFRNIIAPPIQLLTNYLMYKDQRQKAYDVSFVGSSAHFAAGVSQLYVPHIIIWGAFTHAAYKNSRWPERFGNLRDKFTKIDPLIAPEIQAAEEITKPAKRNKISEFLDNKLGLLKDPHARAGSIAFASSVFLTADAMYVQNHALTNTSLLSLTAATLYAAHGLVTAHQKRKDHPENSMN